ncbi:hypothetical protein [Leptolyngbya iicbica]|uniref:Uncharacterized protein n=2 Tax=Cyanophyceae TaxID=3028117 RepID=A0A4Q7E9R8_9CYAN|nr:hypothetical protein [Leptolyngbya sp. LK]RZM79179.1 hypothetical protein DYY88_10505 [Leptolyngbya sp. LK]
MPEPLTISVSDTLPSNDLRRFRVSPLIRITLLLLYVGLTIPLPILADVTQAPVPSTVLSLGIVIGGILLYGGLSEQVEVDANGITVRYPRWIRWLLRRQWHLTWEEITALKPRSTGQGGLVYYFTSDRQQQAFLLPMRVAGFAELLRYVEAHTPIDTRDVKSLAQPWMYLILLVFSLLLLLIDSWTIWTAAHWAGGI